MTTKPIRIKDTGGKSDGCAWKAIELISGDLLHVSDSGLRVKRLILTLQQKSAAGVVLTRVRKAQTVSVKSRTSDSRAAWRQPISYGCSACLQFSRSQTSSIH